jgi:hypothetical protein
MAVFPPSIYSEPGLRGPGMNPSLLAYLAVLGLVAALRGVDDQKDKDKPETPQQEFQAIYKDFQTAVQETNESFRAAKTKEEQTKILGEQQSKVQECTQRMMALVDKYPNDPVAMEASVWILRRHTSGPEAD